MNSGIEIKVTSCFQRRVKRLKKKYPGIIEDLEELQIILLENPKAGDAIPGLHERVRKIRMVSSDMKKGKSGGFRIIYFYLSQNQIIYLLDIYTKGEQEDIEVSEVIRILKENDLGLE